VAKSWAPPAMSSANKQSDLYTSFMVPVAREWRSPLVSSASVLLLAGLTYITVMINNRLCVEPENSLSPNPQLLLPLSQVVQDEWLPHFVLNSSGLPSSTESGRDPMTDTRKCYSLTWA
jgi:hypothetical protein